MIIYFSLGSIHDGDPGETGCPSANNYIMAPGPAAANYQNKNLFSACSIAQFKNTLLVNNQ